MSIWANIDFFNCKYGKTVHCKSYHVLCPYRFDVGPLLGRSHRCIPLCPLEGWEAVGDDTHQALSHPDVQEEGLGMTVEAGGK